MLKSRNIKFSLVYGTIRVFKILNKKVLITFMYVICMYISPYLYLVPYYYLKQLLSIHSPLFYINIILILTIHKRFIKLHFDRV